MVGNNDIDTRLWDYYFAGANDHNEFLDESNSPETSDDTAEEPDDDELWHT
ncbi:MAG TPA: hypothetical protein VLB01_08385 [Thermodesulfobacteriota bacterium]|nr:hypothetical protein [Thermodesulfobacteriota bacterium]